MHSSFWYYLHFWLHILTPHHSWSSSNSRTVRLRSPKLNIQIALGAICLYTATYFFVIPTSVALNQTVYCHVSNLSFICIWRSRVDWCLWKEKTCYCHTYLWSPMLDTSLDSVHRILLVFWDYSKQVVSNLPPLQQSQLEEKGKMCE